MTDTPVEPDPEAVALEAEHNALYETNLRKEQRLNRGGGGIKPQFAQDIRIALLTDALLGEGTKERWELEVKFQKAMARALDMGLDNMIAMQQQQEAQQRAAAQKPGGLLVPGQGLVVPR